MVDRQLFGDLALAVLLMLPLAALAKMQPVPDHQSAKLSTVTLAAERAPSGRISLLG